jgi:RimJ/RimL family protein N-acetyltransferase
MTASVRRLTPDDAEDLRAVRLEGLKLHPEAFSRDYESDEKRGLDEWRARLATGVWFGGFVGDVLSGIVAFASGDSTKTAHTGKLGGMYVRETARGTGLSGAIFEAVIDHATGQVEQLELTVNADNARAIKFYERHGFRVVGRMPRALLVDGRYYDELSMVRTVSSSD